MVNGALGFICFLLFETKDFSPRIKWILYKTFLRHNCTYLTATNLCIENELWFVSGMCARISITVLKVPRYTQEANSHILLFFGKPEDRRRDSGVELFLMAIVRRVLLTWQPDGNLTARFWSKLNSITIVHCYAPTEPSYIVEKEAVYEQLHVGKVDISILMGGDRFVDFYNFINLGAHCSIFTWLTLYEQSDWSPCGQK